MKLPRSKKKRIQNKYIPKGMYCHGNSLDKVCPYWGWHYATNKEMKKIYEELKDYVNEAKGQSQKEAEDKKDGPLTYEEFLKWLDTITEKECEDIKTVYECKLIHYNEILQESLLWDQCKECGRQEFGKEEPLSERGSHRPLHIPNKIRIKSKKEQWEWKKKTYPWILSFITND